VRERIIKSPDIPTRPYSTRNPGKTKPVGRQVFEKVNLLFPAPPGATRREYIQSRLLTFAALFLLLFSITLTLSPAVRLRTWEVDFRWSHWAGYVVWLLSFILLHRYTSRRLPDRDPYLLPAAALLTGWGLLTVWRLDEIFGMRQTIWMMVTLVIMTVGLRIDRPLILLRRYKYVWLISGLLLTALTFFIGTYPGGIGPNLWLGCCGLYIHPSEPLKLLLIIYLAAYLADRIPVSLNFMQLLAPTLILVGASLAILLAQRDLGTTILFLLLYFLVIYMASGKRAILMIASVTILLAALIGYQLFDVIQLRINAWINPWPDSLGRSYQIVQSLIAIASGGLSGSGPGLGSPGVVPVPHSDFIFSSIAEETGLLGTLALLGVIALITGRGLLASVRAAYSYQRYLAAGLTVYLALQSIMIISGTIRLLPLTGVTLPFVSYGGSSLVTSWVALLIILIISDRPEDEPAPIIHATPYYITGSAIFLALALIALMNGWWALLRSPDLTVRRDNPRLAITDRFVPRGNILGRENEEIVISTGEPGSIRRQLQHPPLGPIIGYTHTLYGQAGLESTLDSYLRGFDGNPASTIWLNQILYNQRPPGLDVRLSLDINLQRRADRLLEGQRGALILLNAISGEILVIASHPYYDPNQIDTQWLNWIQDEAAPLINRVTQGQYPPGTALGPFFLANASARGTLPIPPSVLSRTFEDDVWRCTVQPPATPGWGTIISSGCPGGMSYLAEGLSPSELVTLYRALGFSETPQIRLPVAVPAPITSFADPEMARLGQADTLVSPLQMALAAAALSSNGERPSPLLATSVHTAINDWVVLPDGVPTPALPATAAQEVTNLLGVADSPFWQSLGTGFTSDGPVTWYLAGTRPGTWQGTPLALVLVLEADDPDTAQQIGEEILSATIQP
jgi:cell division protein FtsW (lipid II flippase)